MGVGGKAPPNISEVNGNVSDESRRNITVFRPDLQRRQTPGFKSLVIST